MAKTVRQPGRMGITVLETTVALTVVTAAALALTQLVGAAAKQRRATYARQAALCELANQAERVAIAPWDEITAEKFAAWTPTDHLLAVLPSAKCAAVISDEAGPPMGRRIQLRVIWTNASGQEAEPVALTVWKFREEAAP